MSHQLPTRLVAQIVQAQFPSLAPADVVHLGEGCDSEAFEVNGQWVFRFPKRAEIERQLAAESCILSALAEQAPLPIPRFSFHGQPSPLFGRHFAGYPKLPGVPAIHFGPDSLPLLELAPALGRFLEFLHSFPIETAARCGVPEQRIEALADEVRADALDDFHLVAEIAPEASVKWRSYLEAGFAELGPARPTPVLVHNDFAAEHILYDAATQTVSGIIDWTDIALSDLAADFSGVLHWGGEPFLDTVLSSYAGHVDERSLRYARYLAACRGVADVAFGLQTQRGEYISAGLRALRLCAGSW